MEWRSAYIAHDPVYTANSTLGLFYLFAITESLFSKTIERNNLEPTDIMKTI